MKDANSCWMTLLFACLALMIETTTCAAEKNQPKYHLIQGKGWTVCERYVKALNSLPPEAPRPYCHQLQAPWFPDFKTPQWETVNITEYLDEVYVIERKLFAADTNPKFPPTREVWQTDLERRLASRTEAPRLQRTRLALDPAGPVVTVLNYQPDATQCEREVAQKTYWGSHTGSTFIYDENTRQVDFAAINYSWDAELLLFQGRALLLKTVIGDIPAYGHIYVNHITYFDPIHSPPKFLAGEFQQRCHIRFPFPNEFRAGRDIVLPKEQ